MFAKLNLQVVYPPPYLREVWHYQPANTDLIRRAIKEFNWERAFSNTNIDEKVSIFNTTILNIVSNFIPHESIVCNDKDPPWFNSRIRSLIHEKNILSKRYHKKGNNTLYLRKLRYLQERLNTSINLSKDKYFSRMTKKLTEIQKNSKAYWSPLKSFLSNRKIPIIPPLFHENKFVTDFTVKAELFNSFFATQCSLIKNDSQLPTVLRLATEKCLSNLDFPIEDITKSIQALDPNKAHGHDNISIRMLKICGDTISKPFGLIFKQCLETGRFLSEWKKGNIVPIHKKGDKQCLKNYRPVSLFPICSKIFEKLLFNQLFKFFIENNLISPNQSGFRPGDSCINQLLSITYSIYKSLDAGLEVRSVFLDISKAFDKVWHEGLIFKLKQNGISGNLLDLLNDFLRNRKQRVVLNGKFSSWADVNAGVPQGSILGPLLFLIYINDLSDELSSDSKLFADDTSLFSIVKDESTSAKDLNDDLATINKWAFQWKMSFNPDPTKQAQEVIFSRKINKNSHPPLTFNNSKVAVTSSQKHLGIILDSRLSFEEHLAAVFSKVNKTIALLRKLHNLLPRSALITLYKAFVRPYLDYGDILYDQAFNSTFHHKLESIQYNACLAITGAIRGSSKEKLYQELGLESLELRRWFRKLCIFYKIIKNESPNYLSKLIPKRNTMCNEESE